MGLVVARVCRSGNMRSMYAAGDMVFPDSDDWLLCMLSLVPVVRVEVKVCRRLYGIFGLG